jgi:DNA-binding GntR family transcriptional regulator
MVKCPKCGVEYKTIMGLFQHVHEYHTMVCFHCGKKYSPTLLQSHLRLLIVKLVWYQHGKFKDKKFELSPIEKERLFLACYLQGGNKMRKLLKRHFPKAYENIYKALANKTDLSYLVAPAQNVFYEP